MVLWSVPARLRPFAMSLQVIVIHVLGDVPSPVLLGWLQERINNWRWGRRTPSLQRFSMLLTASLSISLSPLLLSLQDGDCNRWTHHQQPLPECLEKMSSLSRPLPAARTRQ